MRKATAIRAGVVAAALVGAFGVHSTAARSQIWDVPLDRTGQIQIGNELIAKGRYQRAVDVLQHALIGAPPIDARTARASLVVAFLRMADFRRARAAAEDLILEAPDDPAAITLDGDTLWASGRFDEAETRYRLALSLTTAQSRAHQGLARALLGRGRIDEALVEAQTAIRLAPDDADAYDLIGRIYGRQARYREAARSLRRYVELLPRTQSETADAVRSEITFLSSYGTRIPFEMDAADEHQMFTMPFRLERNKIVVPARINGGAAQDLVVDTGADRTVLWARTAERNGVSPVATAPSAGIGEWGVGVLELARLDSLEIGTMTMRNVPCLVTGAMTRGLPNSVAGSLSPLALGLSMIIDYRTRTLVFGKHLPIESSDFELPMRLHRLAFVAGTVDGDAGSFVIDTGGQEISISRATASSLDRPEPKRKIRLNVFGLSGRDREAFLFPGLHLSFGPIQFRDFSAVVLNLRMPSALLGFQVSGILGHRFLSRYRVGIDLERGVLRLKN